MSKDAQGLGIERMRARGGISCGLKAQAKGRSPPVVKQPATESLSGLLSSPCSWHLLDIFTVALSPVLGSSCFLAQAPFLNCFRRGIALSFFSSSSPRVFPSFILSARVVHHSATTHRPAKSSLLFCQGGEVEAVMITKQITRLETPPSSPGPALVLLLVCLN